MQPAGFVLARPSEHESQGHRMQHHPREIQTSLWLQVVGEVHGRFLKNTIPPAVVLLLVIASSLFLLSCISWVKVVPVSYASTCLKKNLFRTSIVNSVS